MATLPRRRTALEEELGLDLAIGAKGADRSLEARRAARWFLQAHGWDDLEEQIAEVLGSYDPPLGLVHPGVAKLLEEARLQGRTGLAILELPADRHGSAAIIDICEAIGPGGFFRSRLGGDLTFVVECDSLPRIREALDGEVSTIDPLAEVELLWDRGGGEAKRYAHGLVLDLLEHGGVQVCSNRWTSAIAAVLVPQHQALLAVGALDGVPARLAPFLHDVPSSPGSHERGRGGGGA